EPGDEGSAGDGKTEQMGLGDLLAEALAAYREGHPPTADDADAMADDADTTADDAGTTADHAGTTADDADTTADHAGTTYDDAHATAGDADPTAPGAALNSTAADAGIGSDAPGHRRPGKRWTSGLQLAPSPADGHEEDPAEAVTNPLLRLPDLTAEPLWPPPRTGRRSAAGD
ncbi:MAG TPA: hypothetical protein VIY28_12560, partial [Pseudonocardiaceae bacterium]